jgi:two-component system sensor histidine kinase KdpD
MIGTVAALASMAALTGAMLPVRTHLSIATTALVLVVPVVVGVIAGGFVAGMLSVIAGFLVYDFFFIPPYLTLLVGAPENWAALGVYAAVMVPVAKVVAGMNSARANEKRQNEEIRELFELSDLLVADKDLDELLSVIVSTLAEVFGSQKVTLMLPKGDSLQIAASAGEPLTDTELRTVLPITGGSGIAATQSFERGDLLVLALTAAARPIGLLVLSGKVASKHEREPLMIFANQIALAVERAQLREEALRVRLTEEVERLAKTLVAAVSHDLRSPLASIKASSSTLSDAEIDISLDARRSLAGLIDVQADRLAELVQSLLDMSRIQSGVLEPRTSVVSLADLVGRLVEDLASAMHGHELQLQVSEDLPPVDVDVVLISRVLTNLLTNAVRHGPKGTPISVAAEKIDKTTIAVSVTDRGPGVKPDQREEVFGLLVRRVDDVGAGLGLMIAKTFVEAHGERIWVDDAPSGGARFCFTLPVAASIPEETRVGADTHR